MSAKPSQGRSEFEEVHDINVTPFIDVMLVLLIIFMVVAPMVTIDIPVDLPSATSTTAPRPEKPIYLTVQPDLSLSVNDQPTVLGDIGAILDRSTNSDRETRIHLRADRTVDYGDLMDVIDALRTAGYLKIALVNREAFPK